MNDLINAIKARTQAQRDQGAQLRYGTVASVDPTGKVKVTLQPEGILTSWLPLLTTAAGAGWGLTMLPTPGMQVALFGEADDNAHLLVLGAVHSNVDQIARVANAIGSGGTHATGAVAPVAGEMLAVHKSGAVIRLCDDGSVYIRGTRVGIDCDLHVNGDVFDRHGSLDRLRGNYNTHTHTQNPDSHGDTEVPTNTPTPQDPE